ncbi:hypothetical protein QT327_01080 [Olivibacter sp. 47]|uniref:hypothetical protein n=1 Tax=Olivibacter sp. 47 TaxID=3056486 RepID=UPI0025A367B5|nr:hypothetical protein [Olivibacter sp. 47]MDM8172950.1 hypothetical protein [Olivibacter sp. 47]
MEYRNKLSVFHSTLLNVLLYWIVILPLSSVVNIAQAQTFSEFFKQKKTQKKYLLTQIAALQLYSGYVRDGYNIARSGLQTVKGFTNGEFSLHNVFISSLTAVSPFIRNHVKVTETMAFQLAISKLFNMLKKDVGVLSSSQKAYVEKIHAKLSEDCSRDMEELMLVIASGKIEMTEGQRLQRLDKVYMSMRDRFSFAQHFAGQVNVLKGQIRSELKSVNQIHNMYETVN